MKKIPTELRVSSTAPSIVVTAPSSLNEDKDVVVKKAREFAMSCDSLQTGEGPRNLDMLRLATTVIPREKRKRIARAMEWAQGDDFLQSLLRIKIDFSIAGCQFSALPRAKAIELSNGKTYTSESPPEVVMPPEEKDSMEKSSGMELFIQEATLHYDMVSVTRSLMDDWFTTNTMILYWRTDPISVESGRYAGPAPTIGQVVQIAALNPSLCDWDNSVGNDILYYEIPKSLRIRIERVLNLPAGKNKEAAVQSLINEGIPSQWIVSVKEGKSLVKLMKDRGDNWIVITKNRAYEGFADPAMKTIFPWLMQRSMLKEGEFSAAYMMKHFIMHVTMGESIEHGLNSGSRDNWAEPAETAAMQEMLNRTSSAARLATNHTVKFNFIYPPTEMWKRDKYETPETCISRWVGVARVVSEGDGSTGSGGHLGIKQLIADIEYARQRIQHMFIKFFSDPDVQSAIEEQVPKEYTICPQFNQNVLKEPRQILDELKFLFQSNLMDPDSAISETGRDPRVVRDKKLRAAADNQQTAVWRPLHEQAFGGGFSGGNSEGRPPNEGTTPDGDTRNQPPITK